MVEEKRQKEGADAEAGESRKGVGRVPVQLHTARTQPAQAAQHAAPACGLEACLGCAPLLLRRADLCGLKSCPNLPL